MHQILFQLGLHLRPRWGSLQHSPDLLAGFKGPTSKGRQEGRKGKGRGQEGSEKEGGSKRGEEQM